MSCGKSDRVAEAHAAATGTSFAIQTKSWCSTPEEQLTCETTDTCGCDKLKETCIASDVAFCFLCCFLLSLTQAFDTPVNLLKDKEGYFYKQLTEENSGIDT